MGMATGAKFNILSDADRKVVESYGILNALEHDGIAKPSVFLIGKDLRVRYAYVGKDAADRPPDETLIQEIKKLAAK
jgi:peroxiredoxin